MNATQQAAMDRAGETGEVIFATSPHPLAPTCTGVGGEEALRIDFKQATELLAMFGGEPGEITLLFGEGHSGRGLYAHYTEYPEEGAEFLGDTDIEATP